MNNSKKKKTTKFKTIGKIQQIDWMDHHSQAGWHNFETTPESVIATSWGRVISEDKIYVHLSGTECDSSPNIGHTMSIIKSCILKRRTLK